MPTYEDALSYHSLGWSLLPIKPDKRPFCPWVKHQTTPATLDDLKSWWSKWPQANIGLITGQVSGIVAIDIDSPIGMEAFKAQFGDVHATTSQTTGKPGAMHLLFRAPPGIRLANSTRGLPDCDVRGDGGYVVIAPSVHASGRQYTWEIDPRESPDDLMDLPEDVKKWFWPEVKESTQEKKERLDVQGLLLGVQKGQRNDVCARLAGYYLRITKGDVAQTKAVLGLWNHRNDPPLDWKEVERTVDSIHKRQGREELGEVAGGTLIERVEKLIYPDGDVKYNVYVAGCAGYAQMIPKDLVSQLSFREKFMMLTDILIDPVKGTIWNAMITKVLKEASRIEIDPEETTLGAIQKIIADGCKPDRATDDIERVNSHIVSQNGTAMFTVDHIRNVLQFSGIKITNKELGNLFRKMGCESNRIRRRDTDKRFWEINIDVIKGI